MSPDVSPAYYLWYLQRAYGFYRPVEAAMEGVADLAVACPDFQVRRKVTLLEKDLSALSQSADQIKNLSLCVQLPHIATADDALGCLYVLEGSTLGGAILSRHLAAVLGIRPGAGGSFLHSYGEQRGAMWMSLGHILNGLTQERGDAIIAAARETFQKFQAWMERRG